MILRNAKSVEATEKSQINFCGNVNKYNTNLGLTCANTDPEDEVKDKHQIFDTAQTPPRH